MKLLGEHSALCFVCSNYHKNTFYALSNVIRIVRAMNISSWQMVLPPVGRSSRGANSCDTAAWLLFRVGKYITRYNNDMLMLLNAQVLWFMNTVAEDRVMICEADHKMPE